jgi:hypothetical protein
MVPLRQAGGVEAMSLGIRAGRKDLGAFYALRLRSYALRLRKGVTFAPCNLYSARRSIVKVTIAVAVSILCAIAPISAKAKPDGPSCEQHCREYYCSGGLKRQLACQQECHMKCHSKH